MFDSLAVQARDGQDPPPQNKKQKEQTKEKQKEKNKHVLFNLFEVVIFLLLVTPEAVLGGRRGRCRDGGR